VAKGKLRKLAELWVHGVSVPWAALYPDGTPGRISLPTYPFARERYWINDAGSTRFESDADNRSAAAVPANGGPDAPAESLERILEQVYLGRVSADQAFGSLADEGAGA